MARNTYPGLKTEDGIVLAYNCNAPCSGWVVLYDRQKGAKLGLKPTIEQTGRFILVHRPSKNCLWPFETLAQAKEYTRAAAKGEDATGGFLPRSTTPTKAEKALKEIQKEAQEAESQDAPSSEKEDTEKEAIKKPAEPESLASYQIEFQRMLIERFPPSKIGDRIDDLLLATKPVALHNLDTGEKETVDVPDWMGRKDGIRIVNDLAVGKARERPDIKEPVKRSWEDLSRMCQSSPKARQFLRSQLDQWERNSKVTDASSPAKTQA